jgi:hypothetical protein
MEIFIFQGIAYLQAGGGFVYDSVPYTEYIESVNKMAGLARSIDLTEAQKQYSMQIQRKPTILSPSQENPLNDLFSTIKTSFSVFAKPAKIATGKKILLIDNYDSFTWNLFQYLCQLGQQVK